MALCLAVGEQVGGLCVMVWCAYVLPFILVWGVVSVYCSVCGLCVHCNVFNTHNSVYVYSTLCV